MRFSVCNKNLSFVTCTIKFMISLTTYFDTLKKILLFSYFPLSLSTFGFCSTETATDGHMLYARRAINAMTAACALRVTIYNAYCILIHLSFQSLFSYDIFETILHLRFFSCG